ncbi:hypothetical protein [Micromonospora sp. NPDC049102]|uniref:hypothetical protein n=1 Tax=Micromonospora sp. NPDC049102 TaxID=3364265 RepID=UPI0037228D42
MSAPHVDPDEFRPGGEPVEAVLADLDAIVLPGLTHWQHPGFFGYFPAPRRRRHERRTAAEEPRPGCPSAGPMTGGSAAPRPGRGRGR